MKIDLTGKTALVCGSTRGIGQAIARQMASCGAVVILLARNEERLKETLQTLDIRNGQTHGYVAVDVVDSGDLQSKVNQLLLKLGTINILVNNTGGPPAGTIISSKTEDFESAFKQHLIANHLLAGLVIPKMMEEGFGRIINIISTSVKQPLKGLGVSNTIRAAVANWAKTLATEVAPFGITVNNILPGATETERLKAIIENKSKSSGKSPIETEAEMLKEIPAGRFAKPEEPAFAAAFLASDFAAYITGTNVVVDGGRTGCL
jgi:3-oxoacyl-[acyl-carrier protein] reductase